MRSFCISTLAVVLLGLGPLLAADSPKITAIAQPLNLPASANLGFFATSVMTGQQDPDAVLPCFDCVTGEDIGSLGVAIPHAAVTTGSALTIVLTGDDISYDGDCSFTVSLISGGVTAWTSTASGSCYPAVWLAEFPVTSTALSVGHYELMGVINTGHNLTDKTVVISQLYVAAP
jgi:hypothetical protein